MLRRNFADFAHVTNTHLCCNTNHNGVADDTPAVIMITELLLKAAFNASSLIYISFCGYIDRYVSPERFGESTMDML